MQRAVRLLHGLPRAAARAGRVGLSSGGGWGDPPRGAVGPIRSCMPRVAHPAVEDGGGSEAMPGGGGVDRAPLGVGTDSSHQHVWGVEYRVPPPGRVGRRAGRGRRRGRRGVVHLRGAAPGGHGRQRGGVQRPPPTSPTQGGSSGANESKRGGLACGGQRAALSPAVLDPLPAGTSTSPPVSEAKVVSPAVMMTSATARGGDAWVSGVWWGGGWCVVCGVV